MHMQIVILICGTLLGSVCMAKQPNSSLVPSASIPPLQAKAASQGFSNNWTAYLARADRICNPESSDYANPDSLAMGFEDQPANVRGHYLSRRLIDWMQTLGLAYRLTDDSKYSNHGIQLLLSSAQMLTVDSEYMAESFAGGRGDIMRGFATGYDFFAADLTGQQRELVLQTSKDYLNDFITTAQNEETWWRPYHNFTGVCGGAAGLVALQLEDMDSSAANEPLQQVIVLVKDWLSKGFDEQGAYCEGVLYASYALENIVLFADVLKRSGGENLFAHPTLEKVINYFALSALPGEKNLDARNDSPYVNPGELLLKLASEYHNGIAQWLYEPPKNADSHRTWSKGSSFFLQLLWSNDIQPVSPEASGMPREKHFEGRGLCIWRTGWSRDDAMFSVEAGNYYLVTHNQADKGHFTLYSHGQKWACDPGYANNQAPQGRAQTVAHNCVLIDGKGQALSGASAGTSGKILAYENTSRYGYALADCTDAYRKNHAYDELDPKGKATIHMELDHAYRHTLFIKKTDTTPAYAVILDDIAKDAAPHDYRWQMLSWPDLKIETNPSGAQISPQKKSASAKMFVFLDAESPFTVTQDIYTPGDTHKPASFPRLGATCRTENPYFAAVLIPTDAAVSPKVRFENTPDQKIIHIDWPGKTDRIIWNKKDTGSAGTTIRLDQIEIGKSEVK